MADHIRASSNVREVNRGYLEHIRTGLSGVKSLAWWRRVKNRILSGNALRILLLPVLLLVGKLLVFGLRRSVRSHQDEVQSDLHRKALDYVDGLVHQYPMHLYPILAKAFELAFLTDYFKQHKKNSVEILEVAIGEGTLSRRLFSDAQRVTGVDLNPYSLVKATKLPHVTRAIVGDGLNPPIGSGTFDLLVSNNFLHHVTQKETTISNWAKIADCLVFNENTPFWASGWTVPYFLKRIGLKKLAGRKAREIEEQSLQRLEPITDLIRHVRMSCDIGTQISFLSERTFFLASWFSFLMRCYGPPTPALLKSYFLGPLRKKVIPMTKELGELLIRYDAWQDRCADTFVAFICRSIRFIPNSRIRVLKCPHCGTLIDDANRCGPCGRSYSTKDGMLFLLPDELKVVEAEYSNAIVGAVPAEHL